MWTLEDIPTPTIRTVIRRIQDGMECVAAVVSAATIRTMIQYCNNNCRIEGVVVCGVVAAAIVVAVVVVVTAVLVVVVLVSLAK